MSGGARVEEKEGEGAQSAEGIWRVSLPVWPSFESRARFIATAPGIPLGACKPRGDDDVRGEDGSWGEGWVDEGGEVAADETGPAASDSDAPDVRRGVEEDVVEADKSESDGLRFGPEGKGPSAARRDVLRGECTLKGAPVALTPSLACLHVRTRAVSPQKNSPTRADASSIRSQGRTSWQSRPLRA